MKGFSLVAVLLVAALASGCVNVRNPDSVVRHVHVTHDGHSRTEIYRGPQFTYKGHRMHLRLTRTQHHGVAEQLVIEFDRPVWGYFDRAYDRYGHPFTVTTVDRMLPCPNDSCEHRVESVTVTFPPGYLDAHVVAKRGLDLKVYGWLGEVQVKVPAGYVEGFVQKRGFKL